jgi:hypothetical protein
MVWTAWRSMDSVLVIHFCLTNYLKKQALILDMVKPCLIGGTGRCGTTVLKKVFEKHPQCAATPEFSITVDPDGILDYCQALTNVWTPYIFDMKTKRLLKLLRKVAHSRKPAEAWNYALRKTGINTHSPLKLSPSYLGVGMLKYSPDYLELVQELEGRLVEFRYHAMRSGMDAFDKAITLHGKPDCRKILALFLEKVMKSAAGDKKFFIDDNTFNIMWFHEYRLLFPEAKLIHIYRDPRDVVSSYKTQQWTPRDAREASIFYRDIISEWQRVKALVPSSSFMEISLEALVANRAENLRRIAQFYGIPWHDSLLDTGLGKSNSGRWRKDLSDEEIRVVREVLGNTISLLGYK